MRILVTSSSSSSSSAVLRPLPFVTLLLAYPGLLGLPPLTLPGFPLLLLAQLEYTLPLLALLLPRPLCQ